MRTILHDGLPVAGETGTLERRLELRPARGRVRAKTGTTKIASALSGYVGARYAFSVVMNGHPVSAEQARPAQDRFAQVLAADVQAAKR
jgi:D-alanyl-D-alanine carboxypeptidase/D-alanyl-D-alanine-endopeptidase (penicillin-binding protein 4)